MRTKMVLQSAATSSTIRNALPVERDEETRVVDWDSMIARGGGLKKDEWEGKSDKTYSSPVYVSVG